MIAKMMAFMVCCFVLALFKGDVMLQGQRVLKKIIELKIKVDIFFRSNVQLDPHGHLCSHES